MIFYSYKWIIFFIFLLALKIPAVNLKNNIVLKKNNSKKNTRIFFKKISTIKNQLKKNVILKKIIILINKHYLKIKINIIKPIYQKKL